MTDRGTVAPRSARLQRATFVELHVMLLSTPPPPPRGSLGQLRRSCSKLTDRAGSPVEPPSLPFRCHVLWPVTHQALINSSCCDLQAEPASQRPMPGSASRASAWHRRHRRHRARHTCSTEQRDARRCRTSGNACSRTGGRWMRAPLTGGRGHSILVITHGWRSRHGQAPAVACGHPTR